MRGCSDAIIGRLGGMDTSSRGKDMDNAVVDQEQAVMHGLAYYSKDLVEKTSLLLSSESDTNNPALVPNPNLTRGTTADSTTSSSGTATNTVTTRHPTNYGEFESPDSSKV